MQSEKERDMDFLRKLETGSSANGKACDHFSITSSKKHVDSWKLYAQTRDINIWQVCACDLPIAWHFLLFDTSSDETSCIVVKILARYLDAKLTVCQCSFGQNMEVMCKIDNKFNVDFFFVTKTCSSNYLATTWVQDNNWKSPCFFLNYK